MTKTVTALAACMGLCASLAAQQMGGFEGTPAKPKGHVSYAAEPQTLPAGHKAPLELHFQVDPGYHVNSHTPKSDLLIPTELTVNSRTGIGLGKLEYPAGTEFSFPAQPEEKLDVYSGSFVVKVVVEATPGEHTLSAALHYQACDHAACYPPRTLPIEILFTAK